MVGFFVFRQTQWQSLHHSPRGVSYNHSTGSLIDWKDEEIPVARRQPRQDRLPECTGSNMLQPISSLSGRLQLEAAPPGDEATPSFNKHFARFSAGSPPATLEAQPPPDGLAVFIAGAICFKRKEFVNTRHLGCLGCRSRAKMATDEKDLKDPTYAAAQLESK
jgi:hypothetical protein